MKNAMMVLKIKTAAIDNVQDLLMDGFAGEETTKEETSVSILAIQLAWKTSLSTTIQRTFATMATLLTGTDALTTV